MSQPERGPTVECTIFGIAIPALVLLAVIADKLGHIAEAIRESNESTPGGEGTPPAAVG